MNELCQRRFGFANQNALADGLTGTDCRGEEHDVTIVWSITSGKRQIMMDGQEVHYSTNRGGVLDFSWQSKGNHVMKVICHASPPISAQPGFRQYDFSIDGQSFFTMPKVFQLGIQGAVTDPYAAASYGNNQMAGRRTGSFKNLKSDAPLTREQEDADLRRAIEASISESRQHLERSTSYSVGATNGGQVDDLLGFGGSPQQPGVPALPPSDARSVASYYSAPPPTYNQGFSSPPPPTYPTHAPPADASGAIVPAVAPPGYYQAPPALTPAYASPPPPAYASPPPAQTAAFSSPPPVPPAPAPTPVADPFGLHSAQVEDPFAPKAPPPATYQDLTNAVMGAYSSPSPQRPAAEAHTNGSANGGPPPGTPGTPAGVALSMNGLAITAAEEEKPKSAFEKALSNLVNIDNIDEPAEGELKLTMMRKEEEQKKLPKGKSVPKPPVGNGIVGSNAPLSQIRNDFQAPQARTTEGIMNAPPPGVFHPNAAQGGALVVHGQGPPPLQQAQGFGLGARLPNGGFQNQQNLAPGQYMQQQRMYQ